MTAPADRLPQFVIAGAPKAGTTALHAALATHPDLYLSPVKEPKYYLTDGRPPPRSGQRGPGDAHSAREWMWRQDDYHGLFARAPAGAVRGESTPFYLYDRSAQVRLVADVPGIKVIVVVRDPVDRALSNWCTCAPTGWNRSPTSWPRCGWRNGGSPTAGRRSGTTAGSAVTGSSCAISAGWCGPSRSAWSATGSWSIHRERRWTG